MRTLTLGLVTSFLALSAASTPPNLPTEPCAPETDYHTNPPILGVKGNSVVWYQCDPESQRWVALVPDYNVFDGDACNPVQQFLDDDWFGTATDNGKATLHRKGAPKEVSGVTLTSVGYTLKIDFESPSDGYEPNVIELCKVGGVCCGLAPASDQARQGKIPLEFEHFDDAAIRYGWGRKGQAPLQFETCKNVGCGGH